MFYEYLIRKCIYNIKNENGYDYRAECMKTVRYQQNWMNASVGFNEENLNDNDEKDIVGDKASRKRVVYKLVNTLRTGGTRVYHFLTFSLLTRLQRVNNKSESEIKEINQHLKLCLKDYETYFKNKNYSVLEILPNIYNTSSLQSFFFNKIPKKSTIFSSQMININNIKNVINFILSIKEI